MLPSIDLFGSCVSVHKAAALLYQLSILKCTTYCIQLFIQKTRGENRYPW